MENGETWKAITNREKVDMLFSTFFPAPSSEPTSLIDDQCFPHNAFEYESVKNEQIKQAIGKLNPFKALGENGILNVIIKQYADTLLPFIGPIFRATFTLEVYPDKWKDSVTRVLQKPGKPNYGVPGAYRPIALLDTIGKVLSLCVAEDLIKISEKANIYPETISGAAQAGLAQMCFTMW